MTAQNKSPDAVAPLMNVDPDLQPVTLTIRVSDTLVYDLKVQYQDYQENESEDFSGNEFIECYTNFVTRNGLPGVLDTLKPDAEATDGIELLEITWRKDSSDTPRIQGQYYEGIEYVAVEMGELEGVSFEE